MNSLVLSKTHVTPVEQYGARTAVLGIVFRCNPGPVVYDRIFIGTRSLYDRYTVSIRQKTRQEYGRKTPAWITAKYGAKRPFTCKIREKNGRLRLNYVHLRSTVINH